MPSRTDSSLGTRPPEGEIFTADPNLDSYRAHVTDRLTFPKLRALIRAGESGDLISLLSVCEEMEEKDLHLHGVANTRRNALTGLEWEVVSAAESQKARIDKGLADQAASYVAERLAAIDGFDEALEHMATAIGPNLAVVELVWERSELVDLVPIPSGRLTASSREPHRARVITTEERTGIPADAPKFIVHSPHSRAGFAFRGTLGQAQAFVYLAKLLAVSDWAVFCELFGMPVRVGTYPHASSEADKRELGRMLELMGTRAWAAIREGSRLDFVESSQRGTAPYKDFVDWAERKQSIGWLGQHMTTDTSGSTGTYSAAKVQEQVRQDLLEDDVRRETRSLKRQLIRPMVHYKFPGRDAPLPTFRRRFRETIDRKLEAEVINVAQQDGVRVPEDWAHDRLGIPKPVGNEAVLKPINPNPFNEEGPL